MQASQRRLADDVDEAARYVESLLPEPLRRGSIRAEWRFIPSADLGGDSFGYHPLDDQHFALYLLDVCGHGVGAALLSVSALNALRSQSLPQTDFRDPGQVLNALNRAFPMDQQNGKFFTIWYGVYNATTRLLRLLPAAATPAALLLTGPTAKGATLQRLDSRRPMIGMMPWPAFEVSESGGPVGRRGCTCTATVPTRSTRRTATDWTRSTSSWPERSADLTGPAIPDGVMDEAAAGYVRGLNGFDVLDDDFSMLEVRFD